MTLTNPCLDSCGFSFFYEASVIKCCRHISTSPSKYVLGSCYYDLQNIRVSYHNIGAKKKKKKSPEKQYHRPDSAVCDLERGIKDV